MTCRRNYDDAHPYPTPTSVTLYSSLAMRTSEYEHGLIVASVADARLSAQHQYEQWGDRAEIVSASGVVLFRAGPNHDYDEMFIRKLDWEEAS